jgi:hypothetical protein
MAIEEVKGTSSNLHRAYTMLFNYLWCTTVRVPSARSEATILTETLDHSEWNS